ncbi:MAG: rod shape-determining protein RodA [Pseudobdellovibrionaceae bacterium]
MIGPAGPFNVEERTFFRRLDWSIISLIFALQVIGLINLYSATTSMAEGEPISRLYVQQCIWILVGWGIFITLTVLNYSFFFRACYFLYILNIGALIFVQVTVKQIAGVQRWIDLGFFRYQPSETMKVLLVVVLARYLSQRNYPNGLGMRELIVPMLLILIPAGLVAKQPDLGSAAIMFAIGMGMLFFVKIKTRLILWVGAVILFTGVTLGPVLWNHALKQYQRDRIISFLNPEADPMGTGYHSIQSRIAVGSGGLLGKGYGQGTQTHLQFLPERHTDFIFSVLGEEHGFVGTVSVLGLFALLLTFLLRVGKNAPDKFGALLAVGMTASMFFHIFVNVGVVVGLLPVKGSPLPLFSYGGSNVLATMVALGLVSSVSYRKHMF